MNEHIKQLALQSGLVRNGDIGMKRWEGPRSDSISDQDLEKFAQLIVRECAAEADKQTIYCKGIPWGKWIKQHFGVDK